MDYRDLRKRGITRAIRRIFVVVNEWRVDEADNQEQPSIEISDILTNRGRSRRCTHRKHPDPGIPVCRFRSLVVRMPADIIFRFYSRCIADGLRSERNDGAYQDPIERARQQKMFETMEKLDVHVVGYNTFHATTQCKRFEQIAFFFAFIHFSGNVGCIIINNWL